MFEGLKKKFANFIGGLAKKEQEEVKREELAEAKESPKEIQQQQAEPVEEKKVEIKVEEKREEFNKQEVKPIETQPPKLQKDSAKEPEKRGEQQKVEAPKFRIERPIPQEARREGAISKPESPKVSPLHGMHMASAAPGKFAAGQPIIHKKDEAPKPPQQPKVTFTTKLKSVIFRQVKISEKDADPFIETLKVELLQSDVNYDVTEKMAESIRKGLVGKPVDSKDIEGEITGVIRNSIMQVLSRSPDIDLTKLINQKKERGELPFKMMFIGPNGAGKTTTMAKIANMLLSNNISCVLSASDTFRAAAIEQTAYHAGKLGINVIKGNYGADPSSVAFDAIAHAKAHGIMAVLIDSAGRQETNKSLIEELKKMVRVTSPDMKIFVGEAISGNALLEQVKAINEAVGLDGIILTKLDVDAKGGNTISILSDTTVPILFFGTGEKYADLMRYDPQFIIDNILPNN